MMSRIFRKGAGIMYTAILVFTVLAAGCGTDEGYDDNRVTYKAERTNAPPVAKQPSYEAQTPVAAAEPEQPAATVPEPPREVSYEEAEAAYLERRYKEAQDLFERYTERKVGNPWGYYMLGLSAWKAGDIETAEAAFEEAIALDGKHVKSYCNLARVLLDAGRADEAMEKIDAALEIDPESNVAYRLKGRALHQSGLAEEALGAYRRALVIDDTDAWAMNNMGLILIESGRYEEALRPLARAIEIKEDAAVFRNNLGMALECTGRFRAAEEAYNAACTIDLMYDKAYANFERVEQVEQDPGVEQVDLASVAAAFAEEIEQWRIALAAETEPPDTVAADTDTLSIDEAVVIHTDLTEGPVTERADTAGVGPR
jgi:tetratricopeptide (TPR) repeat protein